MIKTLDQLTIAQFIDLMCGDTSVISGESSDVSPEQISITMRNIIFEYKEIADNGGLTSYLSDLEDLVKAKISVIIFSICKNLVSINQFDRVKEILISYGIRSASMSKERLIAEVKSKYEKSKSIIAKIEQERQTDNVVKTNIRRDFDSQTAALMAHFKFQIEPSTMKATIYANLVARYNREIKAQIEAMKRK